MLRLIGLVVSIGLADSLNPSTVGPALFLASSEQPRRDVARFTAGVFVVAFLAGAVFAIGPGQALVALVPHPGPQVRYVTETVVGVAMLTAAAILWRKRHRLGHRHATDSPRRRGSPIVLGITIEAVELPTAFPYLAAVAAIVASGLNAWQELLLVGIYNLCFVLPLLLILFTLTVAGDSAHRVLEAVRTYLLDHWPVLLAVVALLAGVFITTLGITGLTSSAHGSVGHISRRFRRAISH
jgi:cytochrome c biogenesis protein CcdA